MVTTMLFLRLVANFFILGRLLLRAEWETAENPPSASSFNFNSLILVFYSNVAGFETSTMKSPGTFYLHACPLL